MAAHGVEVNNMKEYIVHAPKHNPCAIDEFTSFYGEPIVELIRCKDCKYHDYGRCEIWDYCKTEDDYFCKDGERKKE